MSTIAVIAIVVGVLIVLALIWAAIRGRPKLQQRRRETARELRGRAGERTAWAEQERASAAELEARAEREAAQAEQRREAAEREASNAGREARRADRIDPDR